MEMYFTCGQLLVQAMEIPVNFTETPFHLLEAGFRNGLEIIKISEDVHRSAMGISEPTQLKLAMGDQLQATVLDILDRGLNISNHAGELITAILTFHDTVRSCFPSSFAISPTTSSAICL
ncbi:hypothetical protein F2Q69_00045619 [Brassica cretica]|uniref:Uncharacterized protein n=1 Tax=Brassica cretica TaxID=69181 RepID=A0A8S9NHW0_BRACR|nr:hypothetical protein F2Q69_00045619 [Brassica cretica]